MPRYIPCANCAKPTQSTKPQGEAVCNPCRRSTITHGSVKRGYRRGCRCDECREAAATHMRAYRARRRARTGLAQKRRASRDYLPASAIRPCASCSANTYARGPEPLCKPCAMRSRRQTVIGPGRRLAIYERDGWLCGFCGCDVDRNLSGADQFGPTLDHIVPRSLGGSDDESNLRLVHRYCNTVRSNREVLTIDELAS